MQVVRWADLIFAGIFSAEILVQSIARNALLGPDGDASALQTPPYRFHELDRPHRQMATSKPQVVELIKLLSSSAFNMSF